MTKGKLLAHWCYFKNVGDALNPYLLHKLTGKKIVYCNLVNPNYKKEFISIIKSLAHCKKYDFRRISKPELNEPVLLCVGSILSRSKPNCKIWGAGFMNNYEHSGGGEVYALRGPYSSDKMQAEGYTGCHVFGDPALLLPIVYNPIISEKRTCAIIPHISEFHRFLHEYQDEKIIKLDDDIELVINEICSSEYVLSTSLHGIIISHAYGIPALWIKESYIHTDGIKFDDYLASVGIPNYKGDSFKIEDFIHKRYSDIPDDIKNIMLPHVPIKEIQRNLLKVAPFEILPSFKQI
jgi:Polysaccharide pyruvyl transferase.